MAAKRAERANRQTGILHVAKQGPGIKTQEAITEWEPKRTEPAADKPARKAARLSQQTLAKLEATAKQAQIQPEEPIKKRKAQKPKGKTKQR
jgi:hypothetical protein